MDISIFGLGYVGAVCIGCFADLGHKVIGVDVNALKVDMINRGVAPVVEEGLTELLSTGLDKGLVTATTDTLEAVKNSSVSMICVGTPSKPSGDLDLAYVENVCKNIGLAISQKDSYHTVIVRSTVLPGTCKELVIPTLEKYSGKKLGEGFGLAMNPEFLRESTAIKDFYYPPMVVIGEHDVKSGDVVAELYETIEAQVIRKPVEVAELIKYGCNVWHAAKVSFANEIGSIAKAVGVDGREVMNVLCEDKKLNISSYYMKPAYSFGGSCLPKDVRALSYRAKSLDIDTPLLRSILPSNRTQLDRGFNLITGLGKKKIGLLGLSFKQGTDDLRESPMVDLVEKLLGKGYDISIYDKNIEYAKVSGSNKEYINQHIPHVSSLLNNDLNHVINNSDVVVIGYDDPEFELVLNNLPEDKMLVDLHGVMREPSNGQKHGICW